MADAAPGMHDLFDLTKVEHDDAIWFRAIVKADRRDEIVEMVGDGIARSLFAPSDTAYASWLDRRAGGPAHDDATKAELVAYVLTDFEDPAALDRIGGAVAEHLWSQLAPHLAGGWGAPVHVEHDHFSVIDHGGDGLSIYDGWRGPRWRVDGCLCLRAWDDGRSDPRGEG